MSAAQTDDFKHRIISLALIRVTDNRSVIDNLLLRHPFGKDKVDCGNLHYIAEGVSFINYEFNEKTEERRKSIMDDGIRSK